MTPVPLPEFRGSAMTAAGLQLSWVTATGLVYQVQYKTNLLQTDWCALGAPFVASSFRSSLVDPNALPTAPQRFYRLILAP